LSDRLIVAGCDVGSLTGKMVILEVDDEDTTKIQIIATAIVPTKVKPQITSNDVLEKALSECKNPDVKSKDDIDFIVGTGYGRIRIPFANKNISEISCHGKGAFWLDPSIRTIIDIGGQDCKVIRLDDTGNLVDFTMNDKCAAGTGRFLEIMAGALELELSELGPLSLKSDRPEKITSQCSVFAESEVISLLGDGKEVVNIAAGIVQSIASRINSLVNRVGLKKELTMTGGVSKNVGVRREIERRLDLKLRKYKLDPQLVGALGAALFAIDFYQKEKSKEKEKDAEIKAAMKKPKKRKLKKWDF
jgi:predicted CoA-substrate-specific enzyme activase